ncbi:CPBP family intramembrane glutamic endopeptidase [Pseudooceanicola sp. C21-150M6]|uniref:CPBP family intramembrane glutamic endopeptidase n=1 Tax=Pseudooceanicola sp. C21-150M6 TaxID=3434355 RepID=UPI003D7FE009
MATQTAQSGTRLTIALFTLVTWVAITFFGAKILLPGERTLDEIVTEGIAWQIVLAGAMLIGVIGWRRWRDIGLRAPEPGTLRLLWLPMLMVLLQLGVALLFGLPATGVILLVLINTFFVGFSEETMFRGVLYRALRQTMHIWPAILLVSVAFGSVHVLNGFITGEFAGAALQATMAACSGLLLMAIFLRTGSLWVAIIYHALWDAVTFLVSFGAKAQSTGIEPVETPETGGMSSLIIPVVMIMPNLLYALWLLRNIHREEPPGDRMPG